MTPNPLSSGNLPIDEARHKLCSQFAQCLRAGSVRVRVRLHPQSGEAWFYEHRENTWHKRELVLCEPALVAAVTEELALLASKPHGDGVNVTQHSASDWHDTEVAFHREAIERHLDGKLESYLLGLLFLGRHDSKQDVRRHVQPGPRRSDHRH